MAPRTRVVSQKGVVVNEPAPKDRRLPLHIVVFNQMTLLPGMSSMSSSCEAGARRIDGGREFKLPIPFLDPINRTIWIEGREFPLERVHYYERARIAPTRVDPPAPDLTIGRRSTPL